MDLDLRELLEDWVTHLEAERRSSETVRGYRRGVTQYLDWCEHNKLPAVLERKQVREWIADLLKRGREASTAKSRQVAVRQFSAWLAEEDELDDDPLEGMKPPKVDVKVIDPLSPDELSALLGTCSGKSFRDLRDEAIIRFAVETGARAGEIITMTTSDTDARNGIAVIRRGKGGKGRRVPFGPQTKRSLARYLRKRRAHPLADTASLWLGDRGRTLSYDGLWKALNQRAKDAGVKGFRPHRLRNTMADRWLSAGGSEAGLMAIAGWAQPDMLLRYTRSRSETRAAEEARRLNLGDI